MQAAMDHMVIYVSNPAASAGFYDTVLGLLGFAKRRDHVHARDGFFIDIRKAHKKGPVYQRGKPGVDHIGFRADSEESVMAFKDACESAGVKAGRIIHFENGDLAFFLTDPDGLRVELTCYADPAADPVD